MTLLDDGRASHGDLAVVVVAAGFGQRLGAGLPKALVELSGRSLLGHCLDAIVDVPGLRHTIVVAPAPHLDEVRDLLASVMQSRPDVVCTVVPGGVDRRASVAAGLSRLGPGESVVLVHDAARCLAPTSLFSAVAESVRDGRAAVVPGLPVTDTIKQVDATGKVTTTPPRADLRMIQTPQGFDAAILIRAHADVSQDEEVTDDAGMVERIGEPVWVLPGHPEAMKVTTPADLETAQRILEGRSTR